MGNAATLHFDLSPPSEDLMRQLAADLSDQERHVLLEHGTEAPFCGVFLDEKRHLRQTISVTSTTTAMA
jgi:peptide-methionine (R)-S-oxide reductase